MLLQTLIQIVELLTNVLVMLLIVQMVIGLLLAFNAISGRNEFMMTVYNAINSLLDPVLAPIRRLMPRTGALDFSPLVLIIGLQIVMIVLRNLAYSLT